MRKPRARVEISCESCQKLISKDAWELVSGRASRKCRSCGSKGRINTAVKTGSDNPNWKGGSVQWQQGKLGRDKDGLSWKLQRQLAWERDQFTCQDCNKKDDGWKPDVHHVIPYRLSFSHSLDNLRCLCRSCHKKVEAKITELWGGHTFGGQKDPEKKKCLGCLSSRRKLNPQDLCKPCELSLILVPQIRKLRDEAKMTFRGIAAELHIDHHTVRDRYYGVHVLRDVGQRPPTSLGD